MIRYLGDVGDEDTQWLFPSGIRDDKPLPKITKYLTVYTSGERVCVRERGEEGESVRV